MMEPLHFYVSGADNRRSPTALLIHGAGGHQLYWPPQVRRLRDRRVYAVDLPGHGDSDGIGHHRIEDYLEDLLRFMDRQSLHAAVWIGHSMGGAIALAAAIHSPSRVQGLGLIGTGARMRVDPAIIRACGQPTTFPLAVELIGKRSFSGDIPGRLKELALKRMAEMRPSILLGDLMACQAFDVTSQLGEIGVPTMIICGAEDEMVPPKDSLYLHANIKGSQLRIVANASHTVMLEQPDLVAEALDELLEFIQVQREK